MRLLPALSFFHFLCLYSLAGALALPLLNATTISTALSSNDTFALSDEGHHYSIPGTLLTLHLTVLTTKIALPVESTLLCLHNFAKLLSSEPQSSFLDRMRVQATSNVEAIISPVHCPGCGLTYRESVKVVTGLWYYTSREKLLFAQRYGVFESRTGRMVAWGKLLIASPAPGMSMGMDISSVLPSKLAATSRVGRDSVPNP